MPSTSPAQKRLMAAAAHTPGGFGGVPQSVGKEFNQADKAKKFNKGGSVTSSAEQAFENNIAEAVVQGLAKGGSIKAISKPTKPAHGGWKRWGQK